MARILRLAIAAILIAGASQAAEWQIDTVDSSAAGRFSSMKVDKYGNVHLIYATEDYLHTLKYGFWDHSLKRWFTMKVTTRAEFCSLTLDSKQRPHISYVDAGTTKGARLRYGYLDGAVWKTQPIPLASDTLGYYTSIALDKNDLPTISYYDYEGPAGIGFVLRMRTVRFNGTYWEARTVDEEGGSGKFNSMAIDSAGRLDLAYANVRAEHASLRFAQWDGKAWKTEKLEGITDPLTVYSVAVTVDKNDNPHIAYSDVRDRLIKYATRKDGKWILEAIDSVKLVGYPDRNGITVDSEGNPYITYYDAGAGVLKLAYRENSKWMIETIDRNYAGFTSSVQVADGNIWIAYADDFGGALRCAHRPLTPPDARRPVGTAALTGGGSK